MNASKCKNSQSPIHTSQRLDVNIEEVLNSIKTKTKLIKEEIQRFKNENGDLTNQNFSCKKQYDKYDQKLLELNKKKEFLFTEIKQLEIQKEAQHKIQSETNQLTNQLIAQYSSLSKQYDLQMKNIEEIEKSKQLTRIEQKNDSSKIIALTQFKYDNLHKSLSQLTTQHKKFQKEYETQIQLDDSRQKHLSREKEKLSSLYTVT